MRPRIVIAGLAAAALLASAGPAAAGIVNVQSVLATEAEEGLSGSVSGTADWRTGNTELLVLGAAAVARQRRGRHLVVAIVRGDLGTAAGVRIAAKTFEHLRYRLELGHRITAEAFAQHDYDQFRRLSVRALGGVGPKIDLLTTRRARLAAGVAYMLEWERLRNDGAVDAGEATLAHRMSSYLTGAFDLGERLQAVETVYAQPRIDDPGDIRLLEELSFSVKASERIALTTAFSLAWDSRPPATIKGLDTALKSSLTVAF